ncbi:Glucan 1,4-alpha-maltohexaosidase [Grifola frondosa]|uniref:Glucan 1,4-alpha-maltohexaosidase n=1 Tax=Grifola frondosa TaxID=5627 RepID=A0A1C7M6K4_GRIFR|nr:Glucan 1,4-alpha-maltohexaosidase [Grifola frondosa]
MNDNQHEGPQAHHVLSPPVPEQTHHPHRAPTLPTLELLESIAGGAHYAGAMSSHCDDPHVHAKHRRTRSLSCSANDPTVQDSYKDIMADLKELFCARPSIEVLRRRWRRDAVFEDPFSKCQGFKEYASRWFALPKLFSSSEHVSARILSATHSPNSLVYTQTQIYTLRFLGIKKTVTSVVLVDFDEDFMITQLIDQWNGEDPPVQWGALWLRRLLTKITAWVCKIKMKRKKLYDYVDTMLHYDPAIVCFSVRSHAILVIIALLQLDCLLFSRIKPLLVSDGHAMHIAIQLVSVLIESAAKSLHRRSHDNPMTVTWTRLLLHLTRGRYRGNDIKGARTQFAVPEMRTSLCVQGSRLGRPFFKNIRANTVLTVTRAGFATSNRTPPTKESPLNAKNQQGTGPLPSYGPVGVSAALNASPSTPAVPTLFSHEFSLTDRVALVSGGNRGLGLETAMALLEAGARAVYCVDLPKQPGKEWTKVKEYVARMEGKTGEGRLEYVSADVRDQEEMWKVGEKIGDREGRMDACVAAAGILKSHTDCLEYPAKQFQEVMAVNVNGVLFTAQAAGRQMARFGNGGSIILIASMSGSITNKDHAWVSYNTSKSAVLQMARSMACELGTRRIRVNTLSPGHIYTNMTAAYLDTQPHLLDKWASLNPLGRIGRPDELRGVVTWLASDASTFCTGSDILDRVQPPARQQRTLSARRLVSAPQFPPRDRINAMAVMDVFYIVIDWLVDRFKSLPPPALSGMRLGPEDRAENALMIQFFTWDSSHASMSWWKHFETEVPQLAEMGITQVWLPPPNKAMRKQGQGYDAYDLWDLGEFNQKGTIATRWGTKDELIRAVATAKRHGIDTIIDAVLNHKLGADRTEKFAAVPVDPRNRLKDIGPAREIEGWTAFDFPGRADKYSSLKWSYKHFTGLDWDQRTRTKGIFRIVSAGHKGWSRWVDSELGNYDYLLGIDIDHRHPEVRKDLLAWGAWVLETTGSTGFRLDAIKHMDRRFLLEFIKNTRSVSGRENMFAVSEYWSSNLKMIKPYIRAFEGLMTFFDVPLHHNFHEASKFRPGDAVTFVDNHDTQVGQTLESWVGVNFKLQAYALILLHGEGHPCLFYGDLYPNKECYDENIARDLKRLIEARKKFAYGARVDYFQEHARDSRAKAVVHTVRMNVGANNGGTSFRSYLDQFGRIDIAPDGWGLFTCHPGSVEVWVRSDS